MPLAPLANDLRAQGWRVIIDTHLGLYTKSEEPVLIVGHSAGGARAYMFGKKMVDEAKFHPLIITLDAATVWGDVYRCPVGKLHQHPHPDLPEDRGLLQSERWQCDELDRDACHGIQSIRRSARRSSSRPPTPCARPWNSTQRWFRPTAPSRRRRAVRLRRLGGAISASRAKSGTISPSSPHPPACASRGDAQRQQQSSYRARQAAIDLDILAGDVAGAVRRPGTLPCATWSLAL